MTGERTLHRKWKESQDIYMMKVETKRKIYTWQHNSMTVRLKTWNEILNIRNEFLKGACGYEQIDVEYNKNITLLFSFFSSAIILLSFVN